MRVRYVRNYRNKQESHLILRIKLIYSNKMCVLHVNKNHRLKKKDYSELNQGKKKIRRKMNVKKEKEEKEQKIKMSVLNLNENMFICNCFIFSVV